MFGDGVRDEITSNILLETSYPRVLTALMCLCIGIIPLTKIPLNARPIVATAEVLLGLHQQTVAADPPAHDARRPAGGEGDGLPRRDEGRCSRRRGASILGHLHCVPRV